MKLTTKLAIVMLLSLTLTQNAGAQTAVKVNSPEYPHCPICEGAESHSYARTLWGKPVRGLTNVALGWTNLLIQPRKAIVEGDNILLGIGKGFTYTFSRTLQGALETVLFFFPPVEDEPLRNCALGDLGITER